MKIALAQINPIVGDIEHNFNLIIENVKKARAQKAELLVLSELSILGYPPKDLLLKPSIVEDQKHFIKELALYTDDNFAIIVGGVSQNGDFGKSLYNSLYFLHKGVIADISEKALLPNYDVFDETRYFKPGSKVTVVEYKGVKLGLSICEDIWIEAYPSLYERDPIAEMIAKGAEVIINSSASPFVAGKLERRKKLLSNAAKRYRRPVLYVNQVGANDQLIFDGGSMAFAYDGELIKQMKEFEEDLSVIETIDLKIDKIYESLEFVDNEPLSLGTSFEEFEACDYSEVRKALVLGIKDYARKCGFQKVIIGLSGGIDSSLVAALAVEALGKENVYGVLMPSKYSSESSIKDAIDLAKNLGLITNEDPQKTKIANGSQIEIVPIKDLHEEMLKAVPSATPLAEENLQARLRANILMTFSNSIGAMLLSTGNKSELAVGYSTLYGDLSGGLAVISDLLKTSVYKLCELINKDGEIIPKNVMTKAPSAELRPDQKDQDSLPPYDQLDKILLLYVQDKKSFSEIVEEGFDKDLVSKVLNMVDRCEYKREQMPPGLKVAGKAFGLGRRMPIAQGFKHNWDK